MDAQSADGPYLWHIVIIPLISRSDMQGALMHRFHSLGGNSCTDSVLAS